MPHGQAGVAHMGGEQLAHKRRLGADHRRMAKRQAKQQGQVHQQRLVSVHQPEERKREQREAHRADGIHRTPADTIGQPAPKQNAEGLHGHRQHHPDQHHLSRQAGELGIGHGEGQENVGTTILRHPQPHSLQYRLGMLAQNLERGRVRLNLIFCDRRLELATFRQAPANVDADTKDQDAEQERQAPTPTHEVRFRQHLYQVESYGREYEAARNTQLTPCRVETYSFGWGVLAEHQHPSPPLTTRGNALNDA